MKVKASSYAALLASAARVSETVTLSSGAEINVRGLSVLEFIRILGRFPELREILLRLIGAGEDDLDQDVAMQAFDVFSQAGPNAIAHMVAAAMGAAGDEAVVAGVLNLGDDDLIALLDRVIALTMPGGMADFFGRLAGLAARMGLLASDTDQPSAEAA